MNSTRGLSGQTSRSPQMRTTDRSMYEQGGYIVISPKGISKAAEGSLKASGRPCRSPRGSLGIRIEGESVVELDYSQLNPMLAYARVRGSPPSGDAYSLPGLEQFRDGVKKVFNALLFDDKPRRSFPKGVGGFFPVGTKIGDVVDAIREKHPTLESVTFDGSRISSDVS